MNAKKVSYMGKEIYVGIDVHKKFYVVSAICEGELVKTCRVRASVEEVLNFLGKYFYGAKVKSCYEAGFSGFWPQD